ncbi:LysM domain-containing protein [Vibrio campbellii]|uniref:LysM peptidoglycan-binding domain-containing protein n=1 Tax=Vibrio campbellii TaxID=680 RepID=UPI003D1354A5
MSQTYTIKPGDTLLQIAIEQEVDFTTLLELNPQYQANPDFIRIGEALTLPDESAVEPVEPTYPVEPVSAMRPCSNDGTLFAPPLCKKGESVYDVVFITGDGPLEYYLLDEKASNQLEHEAKETDRLVESYKALLSSAPSDKEATREALEQHTLKRTAWFEDAMHAGIFGDNSRPLSPASQRAAAMRAAQPKPNPNLDLTQDRLTSLKQRKAFVEQYRHRWLEETSMETLRKETLRQLDRQIDAFKKLETKAKPKEESPTKLGIEANNFTNDTTQLVTQKAKRHVVEAYSINQGRYVYLRHAFFEREKPRWSQSYHHNNAHAALKRGDLNRLSQEIAKDIKESTKEFKVEAKFAEWKADGGKFHEWKSTQKYLTESGETRFAISPEAQLLRWGAQASVATVFEPTNGRVDIGIGAEASVSLAEAKVEANLYLPYEKGWHIRVTYLDANKKTATYSFGRFRFVGKVAIGCFTGAMAESRASVAAGGRQQSREVNEYGESVGVMYSPKVNLAQGAKGDVGFKVQGFAGMQANGQLVGGVEWLPPKNASSSTDEEGTQKESKEAEFQALAEVKPEGNIAFGAGVNAEFQLALEGGKFYVKCSGQIVCGFGAGGGFGAMLDTTQLWALTKIILQGLQYVDYRMLNNINPLAYEYLVNSTLVAFARDLIADPIQSFENVIFAGEERVVIWKREFESLNERQQQAAALANRILDESTLSGVPFEQLLPEAIGIMLDVLVEEFWFSFNEKQESAIHKLLCKSTYSWHKFEEILQRMNPDGRAIAGEKAMFDNLARINAILDNTQQHDFNLWVTQLAEKNKPDATSTPYTPLSGETLARKKAQITASSDEYLPYR